MKWVRNSGENRPRSRNDASVSSSVGAPVASRRARRRAIRWKRGISTSIRRYDGRTALRQVGNRPGQTERAGPLQPEVVGAHRHGHVGVLGLHAELVEEPHQVGVGALVVHDEAGVDTAIPSTSWVSACPPSRESASKRVTRASRPSTCAALSPATPLPMTATRRPAAHWVRAHALALSSSKSAIGSVVGSSDPPSGSTVIPTPVALAASPLSRTLLSPGLLHQAGGDHRPGVVLEPELEGLPRRGRGHVVGDQHRSPLARGSGRRWPWSRRRSRSRRA